MNIEPYYQVTLFTQDENEFIPPIRFSDEQQALDHYNPIVEQINTGGEQKTQVSLFSMSTLLKSQN